MASFSMDCRDYEFVRFHFHVHVVYKAHNLANRQLKDKATSTYRTILKAVIQLVKKFTSCTGTVGSPQPVIEP
jgi:hypothetical protein